MNVYSVSTFAYRQTPEHRGALELPAHAVRPGRYHDRGDPSPLYASSTPEAAMSEFLRQVARGELYFTPDDVRRLSTLELPVDRLLDLMDPEVCSAEGVTYDQLVDDDTAITRALAQRTSSKGGRHRPTRSFSRNAERDHVRHLWRSPTASRSYPGAHRSDRRLSQSAGRGAEASALGATRSPARGVPRGSRQSARPSRVARCSR